MFVGAWQDAIAGGDGTVVRESGARGGGAAAAAAGAQRSPAPPGKELTPPPGKVPCKRALYSPNPPTHRRLRQVQVQRAIGILLPVSCPTSRRALLHHLSTPPPRHLATSPPL